MKDHVDADVYDESREILERLAKGDDPTTLDEENMYGIMNLGMGFLSRCPTCFAAILHHHIYMQAVLHADLMAKDTIYRANMTRANLSATAYGQLTWILGQAVAAALAVVPPIEDVEIPLTGHLH